MKKYPPDVERLMWMVAEQGDQTAVDDFESRFPDLKPELRKRIAMVGGLRGARLASEINAPTPAFRLRVPEPTQGPNRFLWAGASLIAASLAAASYLVAKPILARRAEPAPSTVARTATDPGEIKLTPPRHETVIDVAPPQAEPMHGTDLRPAVKIERAPLSVALQAIAAKCKIKLEIGPGLTDPQVRVDYADMTGMEILQDLGHKFSFTAFDQGDGSILIIPAVDPNAPKSAEANTAGSDRARRIQ